jgi:carbon storage regulator
MLALTRKKDEAIVIGGNIEIRVLDVQDGKVKLGITAPKETSIYREEIYLAIQEDNKQAISTSKEAITKALQQLLIK